MEKEPGRLVAGDAEFGMALSLAGERSFKAMRVQSC
jgi:hypothetical protein